MSNLKRKWVIKIYTINSSLGEFFANMVFSRFTKEKDFKK